MQNLQLNHVTLADEYLKTAYALCKTDPLLLNEMGVVFYHQDQLKAAADTFTAALALAESIGSEPRAWTATRANLAHTYRRMGMSAPALAEFDEVLRQGGRDAGVFCAKGLVLLELGRTFEAVQTLHEALAIMPQDPIATDLLAKALEEHSLAEVVQVITSEERLSGSIDGGAGSGAGDGYIPPNASFASSATAGVEEEFENFLRVKKKEVMDRQKNLGAGGSRRQGTNNAAASARGKGAGSGNDSSRGRGGRMAKAAARAADAVRRSTRRTRSTEEQARRLEAGGDEEREEYDYGNYIIDDSNGVGGGGR
jgi:tetratricopeptide (TPR) repeat protein